jgi:hypothetical protein
MNLDPMPKLISIANVGDALGGNTSLDGQGIADYVHDMKIELDLWFK